MRGLSARAWLLLALIDEATIRNKDGKLERYFIPDAQGNYLNGKRYLISGAGDASILRSLAEKGLIETMPQGYYFSAITEAGKKELRQAIGG